jgi:hypothetical protein
MKKGGITFCNVCALEIPEGEETHEFDLPFLSGKGHAHDECTPVKNSVLQQYEETVVALSALIDPEIPNFGRMARGTQVRGKRADKELKSVQPRPPRMRRVPKGVSLGKKPRKVSRGA